MDTIKTLVIEPLRRPELRDIDPSITAIGKTIGGYAEPLPLDRRTTLWCDEEGADQEPQRRTAPSASARTAASRTPASPSSSAARSSSRDPTRRTAPSDRRRADRTLRRHVRRPRSALQAPRRQNVHDTRPPHRLTHGQGVPARANQAIGDGLRRPGRATRPSRTSPRRPEPPAPTGIVFPARMRETRWTGKPYQKNGTPPKGRGPRFPFWPFRLKPKRSYRRRGTRQIATQTGCARRDRLDGTRFGR